MIAYERILRRAIEKDASLHVITAALCSLIVQNSSLNDSYVFPVTDQVMAMNLSLEISLIARFGVYGMLFGSTRRAIFSDNRESKRRSALTTHTAISD